MGGLYSSLDLVSIFFVKKMQKTTLVHHLMVQVFFLVSLFYFDFSKETIGNPIVIYAIFSVFAFIVNIYLALRLITDRFMKIIPTIASIIYQVCCLLNWSYQLHWIYTSNIIIWTKIIYFLIIFSIITDDIVLIKFLNQNSYINSQ